MTFPFPVFCPTVGGPTTLTFVASRAADATTIQLPTGTLAGDLVVLWDNARQNSLGTPNAVTPSGFTSVVNHALSPARSMVSWKVMTSVDILAGSVTGMSGSNSSNKCIAAFRADRPITSVTASTPNGEATSGNPSPQTVAASGGTAPLIVLGNARGEANVVLSGTLVSGGTAVNGSNNTARGYFQIQNSSPSDLSFDMNDSGAFNIMQSFYLSVA
jgi:hypothetical protein